MRSFTNLLKTSQVMSIDNPQKMREWHDGIRMVIGIKKAAHERYTTAHPHDAFDF